MVGVLFSVQGELDETRHMSKLRIAIVGLGMVAPAHARSLMDLSDRVQVVHAYSPDAIHRDAFAKRFPFPVCNDLGTILDDESVEAVEVLSPASTHRDVALACARAGKHVLVEKPLEITTERAVELVEGCRRAGVRLGVVLQERFASPACGWARLLPLGSLAPSLAVRQVSGSGGRNPTMTSPVAVHMPATAAAC